jgi:acyl-CoA synthetase (AMP-forming)/AMP-acid ligase II
MGLVGCLLNPLFVGGHAYLLRTNSFLKSPYRWLQAISVNGASTAAAPDTAYAMCVDEVSAAEKSTLDLSRWRVAISGGEPVRACTLTRFAEAFRNCGFRASALRPSYGLAESTLVVSAGLPNREPLVRRFDREGLRAGEVVEREGAEGAIELVSCGKWQCGVKVKIVDPETLHPCPENAVGEIWIRGDSVARGYYETGVDEGTFRAFLNGDGPYCRTGDLGFVHGGELFVSGRLKDRIVVNGFKHDAEDIEQTVCESDARLSRAVAAFSESADEEHAIIVVVELRRGVHHDNAACGALELVIRKSVYERHQLAVKRAVLTRPGTIPRTTSGKIRRHECRRLLLAGDIKPVGTKPA